MIEQPLLRFATPTEVRSLAGEWTDEILQCRTSRHKWDPMSADYNQQYRYYRVGERCGRCMSERYRELDSNFRPLSAWSYNYSDGYQSDVGRIVGDAQAVVVGAAIQRNYNLRRLTKAQSRKELPRTRKAREALVDKAS